MASWQPTGWSCKEQINGRSDETGARYGTTQSVRRGLAAPRTTWIRTKRRRMTKEPRLPKQVLEEINSWLPDVRPLWKGLVDRTGHGALLPEQAEYLHLGSVCLHDLADTLQTAAKALWWAKHEWLSVAVHREKPSPQWAVHHSRFYFDYAAIALSAASNHLASAMWHLEEKVAEPLGRRYRTAAEARRAWEGRKANPPQSYAILDNLLKDAACRTVSEYRDHWVHRGLPISSGEVRQARRQIWQDVGDPPPNVPWLMKHQTANGRVCYMVQYDEPQFVMTQLLDKGASSLRAIASAAQSFLPAFDAAYREHGITFGDEGDGT